MSSNNKNLHLTVQERIIIEKGIENGSTKAAIALTIGKDKSTVGKEIKKHRELVHKSSYKINCTNMKNCSHNHVCEDVYKRQILTYVGATYDSWVQF